MQWMTDTDIKSLVALTTYPGMSGKEVSELTGISQSSLLRSRRRLLESNIVKELKVPNFGRVGIKTLFSGFGAVKEKTNGDFPKIPGIFQIATGTSKGFGMGVSKDYVHYYRKLMTFHEDFPLLDESTFGFHVFPIELTDFLRFADYGPLLEKNFSVDIGRQNNAPVVQMKGEPYSFKKGEWDVYKAIIGHPCASVESLANMLGTSIQRIYRLDRVFREENLYSDRMIPDLNRMGYEMLMFATWKMAPGELDQFNRYVKNKKGMAPGFFVLGTQIQGLMVAAFKNFREGNKISEKIVHMRKRIGADRYELNIVLLSMPDTRFIMDFSSVLEDEPRAP